MSDFSRPLLETLHRHLKGAVEALDGGTPPRVLRLTLRRQLMGAVKALEKILGISPR